MPKKKRIPDRFSVRLSRGNAVLIHELIENEKTVSGRNDAVNHALERFFLYQKYAKLINALEDLLGSKP